MSLFTDAEHGRSRRASRGLPQLHGDKANQEDARASDGKRHMDRRPGLILAIVCAAAFMGVLDIAIVNVALPSIQRDLRLAQGSVQWVVIAYGLMFGGCLLLAGRLADFLGRRRVFVVGLVVFAIASFAAGIAPTLAWLVAARGVQGLGAALTAPSGLSILTTTFAEGQPRNRALGIWAAVAGSGASAGVIAGGLLTSGLGWQWIFFVNVPIGLELAFVALLVIPEDRRGPAKSRLDVAGGALSTTGGLLFVYAISRTMDRGWSDPSVVVPLAASLGLVAAFIRVELRSRNPLVPFGVVHRPLAVASALAAMLFGSFGALMFLSTLYVQQVLGYSPLQTGVTFLGISLPSLVASALMGAGVVARFGVRSSLVLGFLLLCLGLLVMARAPIDGTYADLLPAFLLAGTGLGLSVVPVQAAAFTRVGEREAGLASGLVSTSQQLGGAFGVALIATVAAARTASVMAAGHSASVPAALVEGFRLGFASSAALAALGAALTLAFLGGPSGSLTRRRLTAEVNERDGAGGDPGTIRGSLP
jgi:EmrB/QacA subfamily drug resistance transporter